ncbi:hypothetical protein ACFO1B_13895 [Dactylosporangium siamense]|uniref:hypothetical protein n=1 Tax=Dactylosporangium siamense TaxID=685454 RepID=UPI001945B27D|nr:hypothetical protein [Dactylosporangium siamense]
MRLSKVWLAFGVTGALAVAAATVSATEVSLRCAAVAFVVLAWQAAAGARSAPRRLRWLLAAGCVLFAAVPVVQLAAIADRPADAGWFGYGPPDTAALTALLDAARRAVRWEQVSAGVRLGAVVLLAGAVHRLPRVHRRGRAVATVAGAVVLGVGIVADRWTGIDLDRLVPALRGTWPGLLAAAAGIAALVLAGRRADRRGLVVAGAALVAVGAAVTQSDLTGSWLSAAALADTICGTTQPAIMVSTATDSAAGASLDLEPALMTAVLLAGPALLVAGVPRAATPPEGGEAAPPESGEAAPPEGGEAAPPESGGAEPQDG